MVIEVVDVDVENSKLASDKLQVQALCACVMCMCGSDCGSTGGKGRRQSANKVGHPNS